MPSINCLDRQVPTNVAAFDQLAASYTAASPILGPAEQYSDLVCAYWPVPAKGQWMSLVTAYPLGRSCTSTVLFFANSHDGYGSFVDLEAATLEDARAFFDRPSGR